MNNAYYIYIGIIITAIGLELAITSYLFILFSSKQQHRIPQHLIEHDP